eukprot:s316_g11.t1
MVTAGNFWDFWARVALSPWQIRIWCYTTSSDTEWEYCNTLPLWIQISGSCTAEASCIRSPNYPSNYGNDEQCEFEVGLRGHGGGLEEREYDFFTMNGRSWSGSQGPAGERVEVGWHVEWSSDRSYTKRVVHRLFGASDGRTRTSTTTTVIFRLLEGTLVLSVADAATASEDLATAPGRAALAAALAVTFGVQQENINLYDVSVASAGRRLSGAVTIGYDLLELANRGVAVVVTSIQNVKMTTTTTTNTKTTLTVTTSLTTRTTTASTTSQTVTTTNTPVDCVLADWSDWGKCDRPCNGGNRTRERQALQMEVCNTSPCSDCLAGFYLVFVSDTATNCRYNPDPGATGPEACAPCLMGERSEEGASFCEPCAEGSAAAPILSRSVASSLGHLSGNFVSGSFGEAELSCGPGTCSGILSFKAACATQRLVQFSAETRSPIGQPALLELTVSGGAPVGWSTAGTTTWQETGLSASMLLPSEEQTTIRLWALQEARPHSLAEF